MAPFRSAIVYALYQRTIASHASGGPQSMVNAIWDCVA